MLFVTFVPENYQAGEPLSFSEYDDMVFKRTEKYTKYKIREQLKAFTGYETKPVVCVSVDDVTHGSEIDAAALAGRCHLFADFWTEPDRMILFQADEAQRFDHALWAASGQMKEMTTFLIRDIKHCSDKLYAGYYIESVPVDGVILDVNLRQVYQNLDLMPYLMPYEMTVDEMTEYDLQVKMVNKFVKAITDDFHDFCHDDENNQLDITAPDGINRNIRWCYFLDSVFQLIIRMYDRHENGAVFYKPYDPNDWSLDLNDFYHEETLGVLWSCAVAYGKASATHTRKIYAGLAEHSRKGCHASQFAGKKPKQKTDDDDPFLSCRDMSMIASAYDKEEPDDVLMEVYSV